MIRRRTFLAALLGSVALPALGRPARAQSGAAITVPSGSCATAARGAAPPALSFLGDRHILLTVEDTVVRNLPPQPVSLGAPVDWVADPFDRLGGGGALDGVDGNFSGRRHATAAQLFRRWPEVEAGPASALFEPGAIDGAAADDPARWSVAVDGAGVAVAGVWRKSVPVGTVQVAPRDFASGRRSLVTLELDAAVPPGAEVAVSAPGLGPVTARRGDNHVSEAVHVCQAGYALEGPKKGYVGLWLGTGRAGAPMTTDAFAGPGTAWRLIDTEGGAVAAEGLLAPVKPGDEPHLRDENFNGCTIHVADFSAVAAPGHYALEVAGIGRSVAFPIAEAAYAEAFRLAARWFYHQRSGIAIEAPYGEGRLRPRNGHPEDGLTVWQGTLRLGRTSEGFAGEPYAPEALQATPAEDMPGAAANAYAWGGWHDAGDWDRRIQHLDAVWQMAQLVEHFAAARTADLNIPESGRPFADPTVAARKSADDRGDGTTVLPDLIHEALWGISLWRRTQTADGGIIGGVEYSLDGITGSVSWNPVQRAYAYAPEEWCAYQFAMAAAKLGHVIAATCGDTVLGGALIAEAEAAWALAEAEVAAGSTDDDERAPGQVAEVRMKAAACLYRASGNSAARAAFEALNPFLPRDEAAAPDAPRPFVAAHCFDYVAAGREGRDVDAEIAAAIEGWCAGRLSRDTAMGADYGLHSTDLIRWGPGWHRFGPGSNWRAGLAQLHILATGDAAAVTDIVVEGLWFGLGCNPSNVSFVQGLGARDFADPFAADLIGLCPVPGHISFGVAAGQLRWFERDRIASALHPEEDAWPKYARIFESSRVLLCAEHGIKANAMEWLVGTAMAVDFLARRCEAGGCAAP